MEGLDGVEFIIFDKSRGFSGMADVRRSLAGRRFDVLLHMHASMRANLVSTMVRSRRRIGFDRQRARDKQWLFTREKIAARSHRHVMDGLFEFAEHIGINGRDMRWDIPVRENARTVAASLRTGGPLCAISPCSSQRFRNYRNWRPERYARVVDHLVARHDARVVLTGTPSELEKRYAAEITELAKHPVTDLVGKTDLKTLLALIDEADLVVCPDSGPAHMATAVGTPVVGLYATSNRFRTGPYYSQHLVADAYPRAVAQEFRTEVENLRWGQRVRDPQAMDLISVDEVVDAIDRALSDVAPAMP